MFTAEHLWQLKKLSSLQMNAQGTQLIYKQTEYIDDIEWSSLWLANLDQPEPTEILRTNDKIANICFRPNGEQVFFTKEDQLILLEVSTGKDLVVGQTAMKVKDPKWRPGSDRLIFLGYNLEKDFSGPVVTEDRMYRYWDRWLAAEDLPHYYELNVETGEMIDLTPDQDSRVEMMDGLNSYTLSPDGKWMVYSVLQDPTGASGFDYFSYLVNLETKSVDKIDFKQTSHFRRNVRFSTDGKSLYYEHKPEPDFYATHGSIFKYDIETREEEELTENFDYLLSSWDVSENGKIYAQVEDDQRASLVSIDPATKAIEKIYSAGQISGFSITGDKLCHFESSTAHPPVIKVQESDEVIFSFDPNRDFLKQFEFGRYEAQTFKGANDKDVNMGVVYPPNFDAGKKWPLLQLIHGGPHSQFTDQWHPRWNAQVFAQQGYVVAMVNYHGSTGRGVDFTRSIHGDPSELPYQDIMKSTDHLISQGFIDEGRMAASGGSYGGLLVTWIAGRTDRFKALINHAGVYNAMTSYGSDVTFGRHKNLGATPWENQAQIDRYNPARQTDKFVTPMLVTHGDKDYRVPGIQGIEVYNIYKARGLPARLVYFLDENHWVLKKENSLLWYKEFIDWLRRWL